MSQWWGCFLSLLVFYLFACVLIGCGVLSFLAKQYKTVTVHILCIYCYSLWQINWHVSPSLTFRLFSWAMDLHLNSKLKFRPLKTLSCTTSCVVQYIFVSKNLILMMNYFTLWMMFQAWSLSLPTLRSSGSKASSQQWNSWQSEPLAENTPLQTHHARGGVQAGSVSSCSCRNGWPGLQLRRKGQRWLLDGRPVLSFL